MDAVDEQGFREFVAARSPALMRLGFLLTGGDQHAAEDLVQTALARLTARQRAVLVLRYFEDLPEKEIAQVLGCSVGTVRSTAHRSLARLREIAPELAQVLEVTA
ncbi:sigma-70 family RNA polymerase sigma factor [Nonomuraea sp. NPDC050643]|uniref:sigma-70 family RNA polymerase sigma factor n=1 Tax=Nonomuraea sp. NPDC050643 TaxID=3155660 RepID=UPI0033F2F72E